MKPKGKKEKIRKKDLNGSGALFGQSRKNFNERSFNPVKDPFIGGMFFYEYDPKWKEKLPYYDRYPLVTPFNLYNDGWIGINWHYMEPNLRRRVLLYLLAYKEKKSTREYMKISYELLNKSVHVEAFKPAIKRYLTGHVRTKLVKINSDEWRHVAALPLAKWKKRKTILRNKKNDTKSKRN